MLVASSLSRRFCTSFLGLAHTSFTNELSFRQNHEEFKIFRLINERAETLDDKYLKELSINEEFAVRMYKNMVVLNVMDQICYDAQRQGRISFYMTHYGEEGILTGSAAGYKDTDEVFGQYREAGVLLWRGFKLPQFFNQLYSNTKDLGKGRQMPVHYGSKELHFQTISSPLATQIPQAAGAGYAFKHLLHNDQKRIVVCYFGEGAASEGDFHSALNFAATLDCPTMFICRNNGYAISTPAKEQYRGDGIATRGAAYGIATTRVDGNDILAVYAATRAARNYIIETGRPAVLEMMSYRVGHHSTSDDSMKYRTNEEVSGWKTDASPINRFRLFMEKHNWWSQEKENDLRGKSRSEVLAALGAAEKLKKPGLSQMFTDVYDVLPEHLQQQQKEMLKHLEKHGSKYDLDHYDK